MRFFSFRAARFDELGLRRALSDRMVPFLVAAMAFLAALAIAGWLGAAVLTKHWESGAGAILTVQLPNPAQPSATGSESRLVAVQALLAAAPGIDSAETLSDDQVNALLRPWLGADIKNLAIPVPAVIAVHMTPDVNELTSLAAQLAKAAPCMPSQRRESGCVSGNPPMPMRVVVTGMFNASANFFNTAAAPLEMMPPPT